MNRTPGNLNGIGRRQALKLLATTAGGAVFARAVVTLAADQPAVTTEMIRQAEWISGLSLTPEKRELMLGGIDTLLSDFETLRAVELDNSVAPALQNSEQAAPYITGSSGEENCLFLFPFHLGVTHLCVGSLRP